MTSGMLAATSVTGSTSSCSGPSGTSLISSRASEPSCFAQILIVLCVQRTRKGLEPPGRCVDDVVDEVPGLRAPRGPSNCQLVLVFPHLADSFPVRVLQSANRLGYPTPYRGP